MQRKDYQDEETCFFAGISFGSILHFDDFMRRQYLQ
jgi:hypothetical protein